MSIFNKFAAIILSVIIVSISILYFIDKITSADVETGVSYSKAAAVKSDIKIFRNKYGIPHVVAKNQSDAYFALGYLHAADRLWQMDILRRTASGRLSEVFGKTYLENDHFMRCLGIDEIAHNIYSQMPEKTKSILASYAAGVNYVIQNEQANFSFEFSYLEYKPELWRLTDCITIQRLSAFRSSSGFITDLIFGDIADKKGIREALYYIPQYPYSASCVYDEKSEIEERADKPTFQFDLDTNEYKNLFEFNSDLSQTVQTARTISGVRG
ncbi:MAG: penicillin acylase family protein, partial [Chlorobi bacterium]|nr:penicillin acylase family protein [Chlorobiota bacterium]